MYNVFTCMSEYHEGITLSCVHVCVLVTMYLHVHVHTMYMYVQLNMALHVLHQSMFVRGADIVDYCMTVHVVTGCQPPSFLVMMNTGIVLGGD